MRRKWSITFKIRNKWSITFKIRNKLSITFKMRSRWSITFKMRPLIFDKMFEDVLKIFRLKDVLLEGLIRSESKDLWACSHDNVS
jgi:hypothetical protein